MAALSIRKSFQYPLFDYLCEMKNDQFPTYQDILKNLCYTERNNNSQLMLYQNSQVMSIYFDGERNTTLVNQKDADKYYRRKVNEEHISI